MLAQQAQLITLPEWYHLLQDTDALLQKPAEHHQKLLHQAYALREAHAIDARTLGEMLELADEALGYAHETVKTGDGEPGHACGGHF